MSSSVGIMDKVLEEDKNKTLFSSNVTLLLGILAILVVVVCLICIIIFSCCPRSSNDQEIPISYMRMTSRPTILLLYTDDNDVHRVCVEHLAMFLKKQANCIVLVDIWAFKKPGESPMKWLMQSVKQADFYAIVFSEGTRLSFQGSPLKNRQYWEDIFGPAVTYVLQLLTEDYQSIRSHKPWPMSLSMSFSSTSSAQEIAAVVSKYLWIHFEYTSDECIEIFLQDFPCPRFRIPQDLHILIGHLHGVESSVVDTTAPLDDASLQMSIVNANTYFAQNPHWIEILKTEKHKEIQRNYDLLRMDMVEKGSIKGIDEPGTSAAFQLNDRKKLSRVEEFEIDEPGTSSTFPLVSMLNSGNGSSQSHEEHFPTKQNATSSNLKKQSYHEPVCTNQNIGETSSSSKESEKENLTHGE